MTMKLYMHPVSTASRPVRLFIAENGIKCDEEAVDILKGAIIKNRMPRSIPTGWCRCWKMVIFA